MTIADGHGAPEIATYKIAFANDWAESLGITLSESVAAYALLPDAAQSAPVTAPASPADLSVVSATSSSLLVDAGVDPPPGGGFEVRRAEFQFGPTPGPDLVLRSPVRSFTLPRATFEESFYIRMYDGATPPNYSRHSAAIITHLPL